LNFKMIYCLFGLVMLSACNHKQDIAKIKGEESFHRSVSVYEGKKIIDQNKGNADFVILDMRTEGEISEGFIKSAVFHNYHSSGFRENLDKLNKDKTYLIYCRSGGRSGQALSLMKELGFKRVFDMQGGIDGWKRAGYPVSK